MPLFLKKLCGLYVPKWPMDLFHMESLLMFVCLFIYFNFCQNWLGFLQNTIPCQIVLSSSHRTQLQSSALLFTQFGKQRKSSLSQGWSAMGIFFAFQTRKRQLEKIRDGSKFTKNPRRVFLYFLFSLCPAHVSDKLCPSPKTKIGPNKKIYRFSGLQWASSFVYDEFIPPVQPNYS